MLTKERTTMPVLQARRRTKVLVIMAMVLPALAGSGAYLYDRYVAVSRYTAERGRVTVSADTVSGSGRILVTNKGYALYVFAPDAASQATCTGDCANAWPPLVVPAGDTAAAGAVVRPGLLGTMPGPDGKRVVTYHGWPLACGRLAVAWSHLVVSVLGAGRCHRRDKPQLLCLVTDAPDRPERRGARRRSVLAQPQAA
jgi:predicted lipoprotein with Yx(FWY)xxD motif